MSSTRNRHPNKEVEAHIARGAPEPVGDPFDLLTLDDNLRPDDGVDIEVAKLGAPAQTDPHLERLHIETGRAGYTESVVDGVPSRADAHKPVLQSELGEGG